ncbi:MAG: hypothetical protein ABIF77_18245 [bacterium]
MTTAKADLNLPLLVTIVLVGAILLGAGVVALQAWYHDAAAAEHQRKVVEPKVTELEQHRTAEAATLSEYRWLDREQGIVRLPIERAMELVAEDPDEDPDEDSDVGAAEGEQ